MPATTVWYCCHCGGGGYSIIYSTKCHESSCEHVRGSCCRTETHQNQEYQFASERGNTPSECSDIARDPPMISLATYPPLFPNISPALSLHAQLGTDRATCLPESHTTSSARLTVANLAYLNATYTTHAHASKGPTEGGEEVHWYCCQCLQGPYNVDFYSECIACNNHHRCPGCNLEKKPTK
jgi:hypothetical protein